MTDKEITEKAIKRSLQYNTQYSEDFDLKKFLDNSDEGIQIDRLFHLLREKAYRDGYIAGAKDNTPQWHYPSKGELPRLDVRVLVYNGYSLTIAHRWDFNWHDERGGIINCDIIAWQYLPEPPKER